MTSTSVQWASALIKHVGVKKSEALVLAQSLGSLPLPGPEALTFLSHELLVDLGISSPADRARVMLAAARSPPPESTDEERRDDDERAINALAVEAPASLQTDTSQVKRFIMSREGAYEWTDVAGQDVSSGDGLTPEFQNSVFLATLDVVQQSVHPGTLAVGSIPETDHSSLWSAIYAKKPLPFLLKDRATRNGAILLRICTLDVDPDSEEEVSLTSLTNRLMIFVNPTERKIATVHRVDTRTVAHLRDRFASQQAERAAAAAAAAARGEEVAALENEPDFAATLVSIFMCFQSEFVLALDQSKVLLDEVEQNIMDAKNSKALLVRLHHLSRRASVYMRMLELSERVVRDACDFFDVEGDAGVLEPRWVSLREECQSLMDRSVNSLNLVISLAGYRTSDAVSVLAKISGALTPATFIAGYYGTNWDLFPELRWEYSYFVFVLVQICIVVGMLLFLKTKGL
jgi:hypothetical protein